MKKNTVQHLKKQQWVEAFTCLSPYEQRAFVVIAQSPSNRGTIARMCLVALTTADTLIRNLLTAGIIAVDRTPPAGSLYKPVYPPMADYALSLDRHSLWENAIPEIRNEFYAFAVARFEALEHLGLIYGNGHHLASSISSTIESELVSRWTPKQ